MAFPVSWREECRNAKRRSWWRGTAPFERLRRTANPPFSASPVPPAACPVSGAALRPRLRLVVSARALAAKGKMRGPRRCRPFRGPCRQTPIRLELKQYLHEQGLPPNREAVRANMNILRRRVDERLLEALLQVILIHIGPEGCKARIFVGVFSNVIRDAQSVFQRLNEPPH